MKFVTLLASVGMLIAAASAEAPISQYGAPGSSGSSSGPDPLAGIDLAQLLSLVSQAGVRSVNQGYGAPAAAAAPAAPAFSAPARAQQVAYFSTQQNAAAAAPQAQGGYNSLASAFQAPVSSYQASPQNQYGAPAQAAPVVSQQYGAPARAQQQFQQQQQQQQLVNAISRAVSQQYGAPAQQSSSQGYSSNAFSAGSARSVSQQYGAPAQAVRSAAPVAPSSGYSQSSSVAYSAPASNGGYSAAAQSSNGGYSQSNSQASSVAVAGGYSSNAVQTPQSGYSNNNNNNNNAQAGGYSASQSGASSTAVSGGYNSASNFESGNSGPIVQQRVHKHVYIHVAPEEPREPKPVKPSTAPQVPEKHYKILFIKAPAPPTPEPIDINDYVTPAPEQKTLVYVLLKKPEATQEVRIPTPAPTKPSKPEVYFIRYKSNDGANGGPADLNGAYGAPQVAAPVGQPLGPNNPSNQYGAPAAPAPVNGGYN